MRKVVLLMIGIVLIYSCSKGKDVTGNVNANGYSILIQGSWKDVSSTNTYYVDNEVAHIDGIEDESIITFKNGVISGEGKKGKYSVDDSLGSLIIDIDGGKQVYDITDLNDNTLIIEQKTESDTYFVGIDEFDADYSIYKVVFVRQ